MNLEPNLKIGNSVAAILVHQSGRYVMQLRDVKPEIFHPGCWGCFGGALEIGESEENGLKRELSEELDFSPGYFSKFISINFELIANGLEKATRSYYEVLVDDLELSRFELKEGQRLELLRGDDIINHIRNAIPLDAFAIWSHVNRSRLI
jgi:ADP-ribose pyrophosphatase YjhB (NUDIX family)